MGWADEAAVRVVRDVELPAAPDEVFAVLADHAGWPRWFTGMRDVTIDGAAAGVGALRTVSVPPARVQERFLVWDPGARLVFNIVGSNLPGLRAMAEDWRLEPTAGGTRLTIDIAVDPTMPLRLARGVVERVTRRSTAGATGIRTMFPG
jgi:uncharacterized protein YndB with AHSA1/START domain